MLAVLILFYQLITRVSVKVPEGQGEAHILPSSHHQAQSLLDRALPGSPSLPTPLPSLVARCQRASRRSEKPHPRVRHLLSGLSLQNLMILLTTHHRPFQY